MMRKTIRIYEALLNRKEKICHKMDIIGIINEYNKTIGKIRAENVLKYLSRHNYIKRIFLHFYYINSMDERNGGYCIYEDRELLFTVLNKLGIKWYIGLNSSIFILGKSWQTPNVLLIVNEKISGKRRITGLNVAFLKIKKNLVFGLKKHKTKNDISYYYSDLAKTYIDLVYFRKSKELKHCKDTKKYLKRYPKWLKKLI